MSKVQSSRRGLYVMAERRQFWAPADTAFSTGETVSYEHVGKVQEVEIRSTDKGPEIWTQLPWKLEVLKALDQANLVMAFRDLARKAADAGIIGKDERPTGEEEIITWMINQIAEHVCGRPIESGSDYVDVLETVMRHRMTRPQSSLIEEAWEFDAYEELQRATARAVRSHGLCKQMRPAKSVYMARGWSSTTNARTGARCWKVLEI